MRERERASSENRCSERMIWALPPASGFDSDLPGTGWDAEFAFPARHLWCSAASCTQLQSGPQGGPGEQQGTQAHETQGIRGSRVGSHPRTHWKQLLWKLAEAQDSFGGCFMARLRSQLSFSTLQSPPRIPRDSCLHQSLLSPFLNLSKP